jgi:hypothetical protein
MDKWKAQSDFHKPAWFTFSEYAFFPSLRGKYVEN